MTKEQKCDSTPTTLICCLWLFTHLYLKSKFNPYPPLGLLKGRSIYDVKHEIYDCDQFKKLVRIYYRYIGNFPALASYSSLKNGISNFHLRQVFKSLCNLL